MTVRKQKLYDNASFFIANKENYSLPKDVEDSVSFLRLKNFCSMVPPAQPKANNTAGESSILMIFLNGLGTHPNPYKRTEKDNGLNTDCFKSFLLSFTLFFNLWYRPIDTDKREKNVNSVIDESSALVQNKSTKL